MARSRISKSPSKLSRRMRQALLPYYRTANRKACHPRSRVGERDQTFPTSADALATAIMVPGPEAGFRLAVSEKIAAQLVVKSLEEFQAWAASSSSVV